MSIIQNLIQARRFLFQPFNAVYLIAWGSMAHPTNPVE